MAATITKTASAQVSGEYVPTSVDVQRVAADIRITWRAHSNGRVHVRQVYLGHIASTTDIDALAHLNIGRRGSIISVAVLRYSEKRVAA